MSEQEQQQPAQQAPVEEKPWEQYKAVTFKELPEKDGAKSFSKTFHVEYRDPDSGNLYSGEFTVKRLNGREILAMGAYKATLLGGFLVTHEYNELASCMAYLRTAVTTKAEWFNPEDSYDTKLTYAVHDYCRHWERSFRR